MKPQSTYRYSILRYVHDVRTQEFLNVGVLFHSAESGLLEFRRIEKAGRLSGAFPGIDAKCVLHSLANIEDQFARLPKRTTQFGLEESARAVLPNDDSSFQWAPSAGGVAEDLEKALESAFQRHVARYERRHTKRIRHDTDVWNTLRIELERRHVLERLHAAKISTPLRPYTFQHAWQNHQLHAIKAVSFDGHDTDEIADKASHCVGMMRDLLRSSQRFQLHLVIGQSQQAELQKPFESARELLLESVEGTRVVLHDEADAPKLADQIQRDVTLSNQGRA